MSNNLLDKYNKPVPRYTSYPPANYFHDADGNFNATSIIEASNSCLPENISFYIHIPYCKKLCFYCGCNACGMGKENEIKDYVSALIREIELVSDKLDKKRKVSQIHFGGGTPNAIASGYLVNIVNAIKERFDFQDYAEIAIECNPAYLDYSYLNSLLKVGFNRFSLGIQDFNAEVLKTVNRDASVLPVNDLVDYIKNYDNNIAVNLDFIYGLPGQTLESFSDTLDKAIKINPDRLVTFSYAHVPWVKSAQKILEKKGLPNEVDKIQLFQLANKKLANAGYNQLGLDHFVKSEDELWKAYENKELHRNFQGYCTRKTTGQVYALGVSSISQFQNAYLQTTKDVKTYVSTIGKSNFPIIKFYELSEEEKLIRSVIESLMCLKSINLDIIANEHSINVAAIKKMVVWDLEKLKEFEGDNIIELGENTLQLKPDGLLFIRNVAAALDPALLNTKRSFSKAI